MDEATLLNLWNQKRKSVIKAQMAPAFVLVGVFVTAAFGKFTDAPDGAKFLAIGVAAVTGILAMMSQLLV